MEKSGCSYFDHLYENPDPWRVKDGIAEKTRLRILNDNFVSEFSNGLDIGCGEGHSLASMNFIKRKYGCDISGIAIRRAAACYPDIEFFEVDIKNISDTVHTKYDFISCFETLYYLDEHSVPKALKDISDLGEEDCRFVFSVVTIGRNEHRKYFTYNEFLKLLDANYTIESTHPVSLISKSQNLIDKTKNLMKRLIGRELTVNKYLEILRTAQQQDVYQHMFICKKKSEEAQIPVN